MDDSLSVLQSKFEARSSSVPDLREGVRQLWYAVIWSGYRGLDGEISEDMLNLLDLPWGTQGTLFSQNRLKAQLDYYKSINYRPVITDVVRQKLSLLDTYDARLVQLIRQQNLVFQSIADKTSAYANCKIQSAYPRISVDLKSILNTDSEPNLTVEKYAPNGLMTNWSAELVNSITYSPQVPSSLFRNLQGGSASFLSSSLFGKVLYPRTFNLNGVKPDLVKYGLQTEFQTYVLNHGAYDTLPGLSYAPINFDPFGHQLMTSLLGQILSANAGNAEIWSSIQRLGINYSVNVYKQRLLSACGASCQTLIISRSFKTQLGFLCV